MRRHLRIVLNVSFDGQSRHDPASPPYYEDRELLGVVERELEAVVHNEDRPRTTVISSVVTEVDDDDWDPSPEALVSDAEEKLAALEAAGVDNWEGYDDAMRLLRETDC